MAECKNCISENVCKYKDETVSLGITIKETIHDCKDFKNKADFVEVVRCGKCEFEQECNKEIYLEGSYCSITSCSCGVRKENE